MGWYCSEQLGFGKPVIEHLIDSNPSLVHLKELKLPWDWKHLKYSVTFGKIPDPTLKHVTAIYFVPVVV